MSLLLSPAEAAGHVPTDLRAAGPGCGPAVDNRPPIVVDLAEGAALSHERCACGGSIRAPRRAPAAAVAAHNRSVRHRAWWELVTDAWRLRLADEEEA